jgi:hypothetical protein
MLSLQAKSLLLRGKKLFSVSNSIPIEDNDCYFHFVYLEGNLEVQQETDIFHFQNPFCKIMIQAVGYHQNWAFIVML